MQLAPGGRRLALAVGAIALCLAIFTPLGGAIALVVAAGIRWFHRDPDRAVPDHGLIAPADGRVRAIEEVGGRVTVSIFLGPTDVHVVRAPGPGRVETVEHVAGGHWPAFTDAAAQNEHFVIEADAWRLTLYAGTVGRRICSYVGADAVLDRGQRVGHITFGSRADLQLPPGRQMEELGVVVGERVRAGETLFLEDEP